MAINNYCFSICPSLLACCASVIPFDSFVGSYLLLDTLGKGGFGVVKWARHMQSGREVAIKIIKKANRDSACLQKLYREVTIMQMLDHPDIVKFYEVIESRDKLYIVMEYVRGNLQQYVLNHGPMDEEKARLLFRQMVFALRYCHQKCVAHRDVKSPNILVDSEGNIKISDFGISKIFNPEKKMASYSGTPTHFPPEYYLRLKYYGPEVDVWCLGVILYQMVTGTLPFNELFQEYQRHRVLQANFDIPSSMTIDCINMRNVLMALKPTSRVSLVPIMKHPWFNKGYLDDTVTTNEESGPSSNGSEPECARERAGSLSSMVSNLDEALKLLFELPQSENNSFISSDAKNPSVKEEHEPSQSSPPIEDNNDAERPSISPKSTGENGRVSRWRRFWNTFTGVFSCRNK